jgi:hypothetical protein
MADAPDGLSNFRTFAFPMSRVGFGGGLQPPPTHDQVVQSPVAQEGR